jgi:hypothetical protein
MSGEVIKSFLVGLGFGVDDASLAQFNKAILSATLKVTALYAAITTTAAGIFASIAGVSQGFEDIGYQLRIVAPAMNRWLVMRQAMLDAYAKAGVNLSQVVREAILFNYSLAKTKFALEAVYKSVAAKFFPLLTKQLDIFRLKIFANMPKIQAQLMRFVQFIFKAFQATVELGTRLWSVLTRVWDFFARLDKATNGWSTALLGVVAAWKILNLAFLATPLGMLIAGLTAILLLYDDFKVWQEGGKSLFNWGSETAHIVEGLAAGIGILVAAVLVFKSALAAWAVSQSLIDGALAIFTAELDAAAIGAALLEAPIWLVVGAVGALVAALTAADAKWGIFGGTVSGFFGSLGGKAVDLFGGGPKGALTSLPGQGGAAQPLLPAGASSSQSVSQQTHITVNGAADANTVGKNVVNQQDRVNFDMTRNLKGATQ